MRTEGPSDGTGGPPPGQPPSGTGGRAEPGAPRDSSPVGWRVVLPSSATAIDVVPAEPGNHAGLLAGWLARPHVRRWWSATAGEDAERYLARRRADGHLDAWVVGADGWFFGYVETYRAADDPLALAWPLTAADRGWHVLVGPPEAIGTGLPRLLARAVLARLFADPSVERVVCEPDGANGRMIAFCRALGHEQLATLDLPDKRAALMACTRASFTARWPGDVAAARTSS